jgi:hypothetical protein
MSKRKIDYAIDDDCGSDTVTKKRRIERLFFAENLPDELLVRILALAYCKKSIWRFNTNDFSHLDKIVTKSGLISKLITTMIYNMLTTPSIQHTWRLFVGSGLE